MWGKAQDNYYRRPPLHLDPLPPLLLLASEHGLLLHIEEGGGGGAAGLLPREEALVRGAGAEESPPPALLHLIPPPALLLHLLRPVGAASAAHPPRVRVVILFRLPDDLVNPLFPALHQTVPLAPAVHPTLLRRPRHTNTSVFLLHQLEVLVVVHGVLAIRYLLLSPGQHVGICFPGHGWRGTKLNLVRGASGAQVALEFGPQVGVRLATGPLFR